MFHLLAPDVQIIQPFHSFVCDGSPFASLAGAQIFFERGAVLLDQLRRLRVDSQFERPQQVKLLPQEGALISKWPICDDRLQAQTGIGGKLVCVLMRYSANGQRLIKLPPLFVRVEHRERPSMRELHYPQRPPFVEIHQARKLPSERAEERRLPVQMIVNLIEHL